MHRWKKLIIERVEEARAIASDDLLEGRVSDFIQYRERLGYLLGLKEALAILDEVEDIINKG